jgi:molecular chaperone GrpE
MTEEKSNQLEEQEVQQTEAELVEEDNEELIEEEALLETEGLSDEEELLTSELEEWQSKANEYLDGWQRSRADFANYKKRVEREQAQVSQRATANVIKHFLEVMDDLELALKNRPQEGEGASWADGVELVYRKFSSILETEGVTPIETDGQYFDPTLHEAITNEDNPDFESGQIIEVLKRGYFIGDRVLRPATVRVAR